MWNVRDSHATLLISCGKLEGDSDLTLKTAKKFARPHLHINLAEQSIPECIDKILAWLSEGHFEVLNIAGPRNSKDRNIYDETCLILRPVFIASRERRHNEDIEIAMKMYEQAYTNVRHWDQIRWLVRYWFVTIFAGAVALLQYVKNSPYIVRISGFSLFVFASLCVILIRNTIKYHNKSISNLYKKIYKLNITKTQKDNILLDFLPFKLEGNDKSYMSTFSFMFLISTLGVCR